MAHEFHSWGANHGFQIFGNPERYHAEASEDAWKKGIGFLEEGSHLTVGAGHPKDVRGTVVISMAGQLK